MKGFLEVAAWFSMTVAMTLLMARLFWPKLAPRVNVVRFRRRLGRVDTVLAGWIEDFKAQDEGKRHEERHPEPTED